MILARRASRPLALAAAVLTAACAMESDGTPGDEPGPAPSPDGAASIELGSRHGAPGSDVRVEGSGFPPGASVDVGFGPPQSEYDVVRTVQADAQGDVSVTLPVPDWAERNRTYVFVLAAPSNDPRVVSEPFHVTATDGTVRVEGQMTDEGVECPAMEAPDGTLYTLAGGDTAGLEPGDRVVVEGRVAEVSICMQGITLDVTRVERR